jgi:hypothetical protein
MKLNTKQTKEMHEAYAKAKKMYGWRAIVTVRENGTKELGLLKPRPIWTMVDENHAIVEGVDKISEGNTWDEVFQKAPAPQEETQQEIRL